MIFESRTLPAVEQYFGHPPLLHDAYAPNCRVLPAQPPPLLPLLSIVLEFFLIRDASFELTDIDDVGDNR